MNNSKLEKQKSKETFPHFNRWEGFESSNGFYSLFSIS